MDLRLLPYTPDRDVYRLLGIPATASSDEISAACRRLARTFHPDRNRSQRATQEMQVVNAVRRTMTDPELRARYDRERWRFQVERARAVEPAARAWEPIHLEPRPVPRRSSATFARRCSGSAPRWAPSCRRAAGAAGRS